MSIGKSFFATALVVWMAWSAQGETLGRVGGRYVPGEIIVKLRAESPERTDPNVDRDSLRLSQSLGRDRIRRIRPLGTLHRGPLDQRPAGALLRQRVLRRRQRAAQANPELPPRAIYRIQVDVRDDAETDALVNALRQSGQVEYAERDAIISACIQPNDTLYGAQWALAKISAAEAWDVCRDVPDILIAVPDTGVDYDHRDLRDNLWRNETERDGVPGVDDDHNGYIDDIRGYDFLNNDNDPIDDNGHGTHCAGIVGARTDNDLDIAGVSWNATILPLKVLDDEGYGTSSAAVEAIYYAVDAGAEVISCSWGEDVDSKALREAVAYAHARGVVLVAAAGNDSSSEKCYPAAYPEVIGVAATDATDRRGPFSNFGDWVDIAAPGDAIVSLRAAGTSLGIPGVGFLTELSGTSMAVPHVSGACALLLCAYPFLTPDQVRQTILDTADPIEQGVCLSNGRLNAAAALESVVPLQGDLAFDRSAYSEGSDIAVRLADGHLRGTAVQTVFVTTQSGDVEPVALNEVPSAPGVFSAVIAGDNGAVVQNDGRVQAGDGDWIMAEYLDDDDGQGHSDRLVVSQAVADYAPPVALDVETESRGTSVWITIRASEPTQAIARYGPAGETDAWLFSEDDESLERRRLTIGPLSRGVQYGLTVLLTDAAGNETLLERDTDDALLEVAVDPDALLVPSMYERIQSAIDAAEPGQTVWVADGTYFGPGNRTLDLAGKKIAVRSENGPQSCVINGRGRNYAFVFRSGENSDVLVEGFTVTDCGASILGGAMQCLFSSPTIANCVFRDNAADRLGGGIYCLGSASAPTIRDCTFVGNSAGERGGGLYCDAGSAPRVERCTFKDNTSESGGAVGASDGSELVLQHCLFYDNTAGSYGGALAGFGAMPTLANCTISRNRADLSGGGVWCDDVGSLSLTNCIVWDNKTVDGGTIVDAMQVVSESGNVDVNYSCVEGWSGDLPGTESFSLDPLYADPDHRDFHLRSEAGRWDDSLAQWVYDDVTSPCIDAGDPAWPVGEEPVDSPGANTRINLGAYGGTAEASRTPSH